MSFICKGIQWGPEERLQQHGIRFPPGETIWVESQSDLSLKKKVGDTIVNLVIERTEKPSIIIYSVVVHKSEIITEPVLVWASS